MNYYKGSLVTMSNLILIGFMGCGKSTTGVRLSYRMRRPFEDMDRLIEREQEMTIPEIFDVLGEEAFRRMETQLLGRLTDTARDQILATGGGMPLREENRRLLKKLGIVVYLRAQPVTIMERLKDDTSRPLLRKPDPEAEICRLLKERGPLYEQAADITIDVDDRDFDSVVEEITELLYTFEKDAQQVAE